MISILKIQIQSLVKTERLALWALILTASTRLSEPWNSNLSFQKVLVCKLTAGKALEAVTRADISKAVQKNRG